MGSWSIGHWLIVLAIVLLIFGTRRLRSIGGDLGGAIRGFREGVREPVAASVADANHQAM